MKFNTKPKILSLCIATALLGGCFEDDTSLTTSNNQGGTPNLPAEFAVPYYRDWPKIDSPMQQTVRNAQIESEIISLLNQMTLEEKVGQMIQPDLREVTPAEFAEYKLGSILNGGGGWPNSDKYATAADWAAEADKFWLANEKAWEGRGFRIPFIWATDAVHGHNNVFKATVFPHNIGLGAARDPELIERIGAATAKEIVATGLDWTFAPTVATPRDDRWGRVYEGYSEDPQIVYAYAKRMVEGLQGTTPEQLASDTKVISNVKHWVGDGGTKHGVDRGENHYTEEYLTNIHAAGYLSGLNAGAQVVMTSFNSWHDDKNVLANDPDYNKKLHGSQYMVTDVLKNKMGFDGLVVTDWNGHAEINGCTGGDCAAVVNAGNDILMVTANVDWKAMYRNIIAQVNAGTISEERINDAVTRILRVKMRAGLWDKPQPSLRTLAGQQDILGSHRALAREAVSKSLVLLKNDDNLLPLKKDQQILLAGSAVDSIQKQTGGWSLTWQGDGNTIEKDFPGATTMKMAVEAVVGKENVVTDPAAAQPGAVAIVVIGEDPYAEMMGDIKDHQTLEFSAIKTSYKQDLETIRQLKADGFRVVTVFYSGRPLYVNEEINNSDAFVAAWLPGTEAGGITDVLFAGGKDFTGRLSYSWPMMKCSTSINAVTNTLADNWQLPDTEQSIFGEHQPLFPFGYGLSYAGSSAEQPRVTNLDNIPLDPRDYGCGMSEPSTGVATTTMEVFGNKADGLFVPRISSASTGWAPTVVSSNEGATIDGMTVKRINKDHQQDAVNIKFAGTNASQFYLQTADEKGLDKNDYLNAESTLQFDVDMKTAADPDMTLAMHCEHPCLGDVKIGPALPAPTAPEQSAWTTIKVPLQCFAEEGMNFAKTNTPFLLLSEKAVEMNLANIRIVPKSVDAAADALTCEALQTPPLPELDEAVSDVLGPTWNAKPELESYETDSYGPIPEGHEHVTITEEDVDGIKTVNALYNFASEDKYKGLIHFKGITHNLAKYEGSGTLNFELFVASYGAPLEGQPANTKGLSIKINSEGGSNSVDFTLSQETYPINEWHHVSVPVASLVNPQVDIRRINTPLIIFPEWGASQAGVMFSVRNIQLKK